jgi:hypothetical protein
MSKSVFEWGEMPRNWVEIMYRKRLRYLHIYNIACICMQSGNSIILVEQEMVQF